MAVLDSLQPVHPFQRVHIMKFPSLLALTALTAAFSAQAANTVELSGFSFNPFSGPVNVSDLDNGLHAITTIQVTGASPNPPPAGTWNGAGQMSGLLNLTTSFVAYCVEIQVPVGFSPVSYSDYILVNGAAGFGSRETDLAKLMTWAASGGQPANAVQSAVMQAAVWEIVHETNAGSYSFTAGKLSTTSDRVDLQAALTSFDWTTVMNTVPTYTVSRLDGAAQDLLIFAPIPEVSTLATMMLGLAGVGAVARKRRLG